MIDRTFGISGYTDHTISLSCLEWVNF